MLSGFLLYVRPIDINDREIILVYRFYDRLYIFADLIVAFLEAVGNYDVENDVGVRGTRYHTEIVDGELGVDAGDERGNLLANRIGQLVVGCDRVHMYDGIATHPLTQFLFDIVDHIVRGEHIGVAGDLRVERDHSTRGAVIVNDQIVDALNALVRVNYVLDILDEILARGSAEKGIHRLLDRAKTREKNESRDRKTAVSVDIDRSEARDDEAEKYRARRDRVVEAVLSRCTHCRRGYLLADAEIVESHISLDEDRADEDDDGNDAEFYRFGAYDLFNRALAELKADKDNEHRDDQTRNILDPSVSEGVILIRLLTRHTETDQGDDGRARVGQVVEGVSHDRDRSADRAREHFDAEEKNVEDDAHNAAECAVSTSHARTRYVRAVFDENF